MVEYDDWVYVEASEDEYKKDELVFQAHRVVKEYGYDKWFFLVGIELKTNELVSIGIRDGTIYPFVNKFNDCCDQWDLFDIIIGYEIPMKWKRNKYDYWMPIGPISKQGYELLKQEMSDCDYRSAKTDFVILTD